MKELKKRFVYYFNYAYDQLIDKLLQIETSKSIQLDEHDNVINFMYEPLPYRYLKKIFNKYPICEDGHLIDFGCGKARILVMAASYGCKNLYGIDINEHLLDTAEKNLKYHTKKYNDTQFQLFCMDAKKYQFDPKINVLFFYNPFQLKIFIYVFKALFRSIDEHPRKVTIYFSGAQRSTIEYFEANSQFKILGKEDKLGTYIYVYEP